jgi:site-specific DNA recombinase
MATAEHHPAPIPDDSGMSPSGAPAVVYVRVSSSGQMGRDGDADGYSIPAQVQACERKATELGCGVARAYVERAESARSDDRPVLQQMLRELPGLGARYLIVHKVDRLARNRLDDATLYQRLIGMNVTLVSATENIDATPAGRLMHGMLATFAEYYSNNLATEIKKGLHQKHQQGGTPFKPPIGYRPKRELIGNQDVRSVEVDPDRAPLVQTAFDLYATGDWSLHALATHMEAHGLRSRPTPKRGPAPLRMTSIHKLLTNIYYVGVVEYAGRRVLGRHEPLIDRDTFDRVQAQLAARAKAGDRPSKHEHYLRGSLGCAACGGRLLYSQNTGNGGTYEYFSCINRKSRTPASRCSSTHYPAPLIERAVEEHYRTVRLSKKTQDAIRADIEADANERLHVIQRDIDRHTRTIRDLEDNQARLVQLSYKGLVSDEVLGREQQRLDSEQRQARDLLAKAQGQGTDLRAVLAEILARTTTPHAAYLASCSLGRRILNQVFFKRILIGEDNEILGTTLTPAYAAVAAGWEPAFGQPRRTSAQRAQERPRQAIGAVLDSEASRENPDPSSWGQGLLLTQMVETAGIEPANRSRRP